MTSPLFSTHGCRLNTFETEAMKTLADQAGLKNAIVVNTCAVTGEAVRKAKQDIRKLSRLNPEAKIIVTGCAAQIQPEIFSRIENVTSIIGNKEKMQPKTWERFASNYKATSNRIQVGDIMASKEVDFQSVDSFGIRARAFVQVQNGCDHRCSFCIIPYGRGNSRSVPLEIVIKQINHLVDCGYNEVVLTGVDLTSWGKDLSNDLSFGDLVLQILIQIPGLSRLRISSIDSIEVDEKLIEAIANYSRFMPHLHLSLQHGDDIILKRMKRRHLRDDAIRFCDRIRCLRPDIIFGADIIAGFPTETDEHFENSINLVNECELTWLHVFPFSARQGTPAARMPQVDGTTIRDRAARLRNLKAEKVANHLKAQVGHIHQVLMESPYKGRTTQFTEVNFKETQKVGAIVSAHIVGVTGNQLVAAFVE
ncbi:MAG: tRNA (N(6)-L-threonylcarbamoyladenosine(37)-C(2))-methylthiotransferase MtaB [Aestuariivita sp.]|nr:tRNA (N(6)-L-threonylcarbamoyladenosine(37)-C(2))-methylthiotransferase MtaB [Aestuariivita sp.]